MMNQRQYNGIFMFSVDVEDFPVIKDGKSCYAGRVTELTDQYIEFLRKRKMRATFFILGEVAERNPELVRKLVDQGHEIGCHGYAHVTLDKQNPGGFEADLTRALEVLHQAGATKVWGYRAPFLSITPKTVWAYDVLSKLGFRYSSSVMPHYNPSFGWPDFGERPRKQGQIWELPVSLMPSLPLAIPVAGGVYFRMLPFRYISRAFRLHLKQNKPVFGYFHPYDIDWESESKQCAWLQRNPLFNFFMFYNRKAMLSRLERVMQQGFEILPYSEFLAKHAAGVAL
ncbi:MAG: polysaccharide deacetylase family protein [Bdellovibrionota bacterium]